MADFVLEPARRTPVLDTVDVLVAGGGPAGIAAALAAAREGARTMLVERFGYLGGMITGAHVVAILGVGNGRRPLARGITEELRQRLSKFGGVIARQPAMGENEEQTSLRNSGDYRVDAEIFKWQAQEMLLEAGVRLRLHTWACDPLMEEGRVAGAIVESKSGRQAIRAAVTVDATADADLAFRAGCACANDTHEVTLVYQVEGVDQARVAAFQQSAPQEYAAIQARAAELHGGVRWGERQLLKGIDVTDAEALTRAEVQMRQECFGALTYLREKLPGYEKARITQTWPQLGVRQSRRIHGVYTVCNDDLKTSRHFLDGIACLGVYFPASGPIYALEGLGYDLPYGCLVPETVDGLLVVGRCVASDYVACNTLRLIVPCFATGQAGGVAAALAAQNHCPPRAVSISALRELLLGQDVYLG